MVIAHLKIEKDGPSGYKTNFKKEDNEEHQLVGQDLEGIVGQVKEILQLSPLTGIDGKPISKYLICKDTHENNGDKQGYVNYKTKAKITSVSKDYVNYSSK